MIARCGLATRLSDARPRAELAGSVRPLRRDQGRRDPHTAARGRRAAAQQSSPDVVARPQPAQRTEQAAACPTPSGAARVTAHAAALARPTRRSPLELPASTTRTTTHATPDPGTRAPTGPRESPLGYRRIQGELIGLGHQ